LVHVLLLVLQNAELANLNKELDKHRELVSSGDVRVKWAHNKLKAELEAHKVGTWKFHY